MTVASSPLLTSESYALHLTHLASLSLNAGLSLKALPPVSQLIKGDGTEARESDAEWWEDDKELARVIRMYRKCLRLAVDYHLPLTVVQTVSPAIETFGQHRIHFGSSTAYPLPNTSSLPTEAVEQVVPSKDWYAVLRKAWADLGADTGEMSELMGGSAKAVYGL